MFSSKRYQLPAIFLFFSAAILLAGCSNSEKKNSSDAAPESIFFDYQIRGEEGSDVVTVLIQYRYNGENGSTLTLDEPASVSLDGEMLKGDSSKITGAYYEIQKPVEAFSGNHTIVFTNTDKTLYKEDFNFQPIKLLTEIPATWQRGDMELDLTGLEAEDFVKVIMTDTVFASEGIERIDTVRKGKLTITREEMAGLADGPIQLELIRESDSPVKKGTAEGGRLFISYGLKREFLLIQ